MESAGTNYSLLRYKIPDVTPVFRVLAITGAVTAFILGLILADAYETAAAVGDVDALGDFIVISLLVVLAVVIFGVVTQFRR